ncbi:unnamed protein product [Rangifer tarandus platyrhynchus]|uniref:Uncharacterized protein n=1 Tax=Rangifer tarandus platyrhynchus TaxID=3082113 RepID=A0AC59YX38_RANTA
MTRGSRQVRASRPPRRSPRALGALPEGRLRWEPESSFGFVFLCRCIYKDTSNFFSFSSLVYTALKASTFGKGRRKKLSNILGGGWSFLVFFFFFKEKKN